jgi:predicted RNase H-like nuclease (RuvC/YqgF family)
VSAVEEYRKHTETCDLSDTEVLADAAIAELEAENKAYFVALEGAKAAIIDLSQRAEQAEANWRTQKAATDAMQLDRARIAELEAELAEEARQADEAVDSCRERIAELEAELAALKAVAEAMEEFIDSCTYHMRGGNTVSYDGPRAEEGGE